VNSTLHRLLLTVAGIAAVVSCSAGAATGGTAVRGAATERITATFLTIGRSDKPTHVVATGPISGIGEATQTEKNTASGGQVNYVTLHFAGGTVRMTAVEPRFGWKLDAKTCTGSAFGNGTYTITGGTGSYSGASGKGTFTTSGTALAQRTSTGKCLGDKTPPAGTVFYVKIVLTGTATL
jgi:hypothetical protein